MRKMKAMKKVLAGLLAAVVAATSVAPVYAATAPRQVNSPGDDTAKKPVSTTNASGTQADGTKTEVNTSSKGTATLTEVKAAKKTTVKVGQKVTVNGVKYTVTKISADAFKKCAKMQNVTIPSTVKTIAKNAFKGAKKLKKAEIKGSPVIKASALSGASKLKTVTFTNAPTAEKNAFKGLKLNKLVVNKNGVFKKGAFAGATVKKLVVNKNTVFKKGAFTGNSTKDSTLTVSGKMTKKQYNNFVKMVRAAGFKGDIKKA